MGMGSGSGGNHKQRHPRGDGIGPISLSFLASRPPH